VVNLEATIDCGGKPYIPFKSNATDEKGGLWAQILLYFCERRDEFLKHYHKRSNAESTIGSMKTRTGDGVRSKTDTAMVNEACCKVIVHNICCVIQEMYELGVKPDFWEDGNVEEEDGTDNGCPVILRFPA
jgi:hypothetical protein